ncbi:MAG: UDP-N-acetylglucosamine 2-epimerase [Oscillospiraceae bacterium]
MKVLILSCFTGEGHNSAAWAVEEALIRNGAECELADPVAFAGEKAQNFVSGCYNNMIKKRPGAFGAVYKVGSLYSATKAPSPIYWANSLYAQKLYDYIREQGFDAVVATHLYGMEAMTAIRRKLGAAIPSYGVLTDYTCIPFFRDTVLDGYFAPHEEMKAELVREGIPEERVIVSGIPVSARFREHLPREEARERLSIPRDKQVYLLMTGGVGCENISELCDELLHSERDDFAAYVLVGRNEELKKTLDARYAGDERLKTVSFTRQVNLYMNAADVMLSKPGGLSSTEAAVANVPLVHFRAIPGCETQNAIFFSSHGMSVWAKTKQEAVADLEELARDGERAERMRAMQRQTINPDAAGDIARHMMKQ